MTRRKVDRSGVPSVHPDLRLAQSRIEDALAADIGSPAAIQAAQEALGFVGLAVLPRIGPAAQDGVCDGQRAEWLRVLRFLRGTLLFKNELSSLIVALTELDRGLVDEQLRPTGSIQGGRTSTDRLRWQAVAVEAFDELASTLGGKGKAAAKIEETLGVSISTVRDWRARVAKEAPPEFKRPELSPS